MLGQRAGKSGRTFIWMALADLKRFACEFNIPLQGLREFAPMGKNPARKQGINRHSRPFVSIDIPMLHRSFHLMF